MDYITHNILSQNLTNYNLECQKVIDVGNILVSMIQFKGNQPQSERFTLMTSDPSSQIQTWEFNWSKGVVEKVLYFIKKKSRLYHRKFIMYNIAQFSFQKLGEPSLIQTFQQPCRVHCMIQLKKGGEYSNTIAIGCGDQSILIWDTQYNMIVTRFNVNCVYGYTSSIIQMSDDMLIAAHRDYGVVKWDFPLGKIIQEISSKSICVALLNLENSFIFDDVEYDMNTFEITGRKCKWIISSTCMTIYQVSPLLIASGKASGSILIWELENGSIRSSWQAHDSYIKCISKITKGSETLLLSGGFDLYLKIWNSKNECVSSYIHGSEVTMILTYCDLVLTCSRKSVKVFELKKKRENSLTKENNSIEIVDEYF